MTEADEQELRQYRAMLFINKHKLDDELEVQSEIQDRISSKLARANTKMLESKDALAKTEARLLEDFRTEEKSTKDLAEAKAKRHPDRQRAFERFMEAREDHEEWSGLLDAWKSKGFGLREMGGLFHAQYFSVDSISAPRVRKDRDARPAQDRYERGNTRGEGNAPGSRRSPPDGPTEAFLAHVLKDDPKPRTRITVD